MMTITWRCSTRRLANIYSMATLSSACSRRRSNLVAPPSSTLVLTPLSNDSTRPSRLRKMSSFKYVTVLFIFLFLSQLSHNCLTFSFSPATRCYRSVICIHQTSGTSTWFLVVRVKLLRTSGSCKISGQPATESVKVSSNNNKLNFENN